MRQECSICELALAAGFELVLSLAPLSDPDAARAARVLLDPRYAASFVLSGGSIEVDAWVEGLHRWVPGGDPIDIVRTAGQSSSLLHRPGAVFLRGHATELKLASAGDFSGQSWLLSGAAVIDRIGEPDDDGGDDISAVHGSSRSPYVIYSADTHRFTRLLEGITGTGHRISDQDQILALNEGLYLIDERVGGLVDGSSSRKSHLDKATSDAVHAKIAVHEAIESGTSVARARPAAANTSASVRSEPFTPRSPGRMVRTSSENSAA